jgi:hypothetical protein
MIAGRILPVGLVAAIVMACHGIALHAQRGQPAAPQPGRAAAPFDLTGTWVSVVTEDWRWRMVTPPRGDYPRVPLNPQGRKLADAWDLARDKAEGGLCRAFGAGGIMRMPGRLQIAWLDAETLKLDYDAGTQTRLLHFDKSMKPTGERTWQGWSVAEWEFAAGEGRGGAGQPRTGSLKVVTSQARAGYLRKNGVPYSEDMTMTEYFDRHDDFGDQWFTVMSVIDDPRYLTQPFVLTTSFRKEPDNSKFQPTPCAIDPPLK